MPDNEALFACILEGFSADSEMPEDWRFFTEIGESGSAKRTLDALAKGLARDKAKPRLLIVLDGMDEVALKSGVDISGWNNLNFLIETGSFQFVTASCDQLGNLAFDPEVRGSLFIDRFSDFVSLPPVDERELSSWLAASSCGESGYDRAAQVELLAQTGGHPRLLAALLGKLPDGATASQIASMADELVQTGHSDIRNVFTKLSLEMREALATLDEPGRTTSDAKAALLARGMIAVTRAGRVEQASKMIGKLAEASRPGESTLRRLFATEADCFANLAHVLELRLAATRGNSQHPLFKHLEIIIGSLHDPDGALKLLRKAEDEVVDIIKKHIGSSFPDFKLENAPRGFRSGDRAQNVGAVDWLTRDGTMYSNPRLTRAIHVLLSHIHDGGAFGNHYKDQPKTPGAAHALASSALELAAEMKRTGLIQ